MLRGCLGSLVVFGLIFSLASYDRLLIHSEDNHFVYQADAWLKGSLSLKRRPHHQNDWASVETVTLNGQSAETYGKTIRGFFVNQSKIPDHFRTTSGHDLSIPKKDIDQRKKNTYVSFPPGPSALMLPWVAWFGYGVNDVIFTIIFAALNCMLIGLLYERLSTQERKPSSPEKMWWMVFFGLGTCHFWLSVQGKVWFSALVIGATFHLLYLYFALDVKRPFLAGLSLAVAFSCRATLVFSAGFIFLELWAIRKKLTTKEFALKFVYFSAPCLVIGILLLINNHLRFDHPAEFGHTYLAGGNLQRIRDFGLFHGRFVLRNLSAMLTLVPQLDSQQWLMRFSKHGMSIFLSSPLLLFLLVKRPQAGRGRRLIAVSALMLCPLLLYQNTGWEQFSYRFLLDLLPLISLYLMLTLTKLSHLMKAMIVIGVLINLFGALTFQRADWAGYYSDFLPLWFSM